MSSAKSAHDFFELLQDEHAELGHMLNTVRDGLADQQRDKVQVENLLTQLADLIESHFRHEEQGGYLTEATGHAPRLIHRAEALLAEHESLSEEIQKLRILAHSGVESASWWQLIERDFQNFASHLLDHEAAENKLVQEAFTDDIGTKD